MRAELTMPALPANVNSGFFAVKFSLKLCGMLVYMYLHARTLYCYVAVVIEVTCMFERWA